MTKSKHINKRKPRSVINLRESLIEPQTPEESQAADAHIAAEKKRIKEAILASERMYGRRN